MKTYIHDYSKIRTVKEVFQVSSDANTLKCSALLEVILLLFSFATILCRALQLIHFRSQRGDESAT